VDDDHDDDHDSGVEDNESTTSTSLKSSVEDYTYENGRRYHAFRAGEYPLPNDEEEQARMDLLHHIWRLILGGALLLSDIHEPQRILDVGTGTGIWAIDIADVYPEAQVLATDLSPIQPSWVPPNCHFYVDDAESGWEFEPLDLIHGRSLCGSISDWPQFYRQSFRSLKPGGYIEIQEYEAWVSALEQEPPWTAHWNVTLNEASAMFGKYLNIANKHADWMREAGFVDVKDKVFQVSLSEGRCCGR